MTAPLPEKDNLTESIDVAVDELDGIYPQMALEDSVEDHFGLGAAPADTGTAWMPGQLSRVSPAYQRAEALLSIYRSRPDFLDQCKFESGIRTNRATPRNWNHGLVALALLP
jgi:hypothetical protein